MAYYVKREQKIVEAFQWFPDNLTLFTGVIDCSACGCLQLHAKLQDTIICPGSWIVNGILVLTDKEFIRQYRSADISEHYKRVSEFKTLAGQTISDANGITDDERRLLCKLILEETKEACAELGVEVDWRILRFELGHLLDKAKLAKELADIKVVTTGVNVSYGIPDEVVQELVDNNNLAKFGEGSGKNQDGKHLPPPGFDKTVVLQEIRKIVGL